MSEAGDALKLGFAERLMEALHGDSPPDKEWILAYSSGYGDGFWDGVNFESQRARAARERVMAEKAT